MAMVLVFTIKIGFFFMIIKIIHALEKNNAERMINPHNFIIIYLLLIF